MLYRTKIFLLFFVIGVIPIILVGSYNYQHAHNEILTHVEDMLSTTAELEKRRINDALHLYEEKLALVNSRTHMRVMLSEYNQQNDPKLAEQLNKMLIDVKISIPDHDFKIVSITNLDGKIIASSDSLLIGSYVNNKHFPDVSDSFKFGFLNKKYDSAEGYISGPLLLDNKILGMSYIVVDPHELTSLEQKSFFGKTGEYLIAQKNENGDAVFINSIKFENDPNTRTTIPQEEFDIPITQALSKKEAFLTNSVDYRGEPVLAITRYIDEADLGLVSKIDVSEALAPAEAIKNSVVISSILLVLIIFTISFMFSRALMKPIKKLDKLTKEFSKENWDTVSDLQSNDEFYLLGKSMEKMAGTIKKKNQTIQGQLKEATNSIILERQLLLSRSELESEKKFSVEKEEFEAMVSHELKTPLFPIKTHCEMLKDPTMLGKLNKEQLESVNEIELMTSELERLTSDILDAQKLNMNRIKFNLHKFKIGKLLKEVIDTWTPVFIKKEIELSSEYYSSEIILTDKQRLFQVFSNLLRNSADFVEHGVGKIRIGFKNNDDTIVFFVNDNGCGIPSDKIKHLFKKFYQVDTTLKRKHQGSGLGLVICKGIVEGLGGKIWADSKPGKGTTFYFSIPKNTQNPPMIVKKSAGKENYSKCPT